jgi:hypothetical protein
MGAMVTRDEELHERLKLTHMRVGWGIGGNDAEAILRSLPSLPLRYRAHDVAARELAAWLQRRPEIAQLLHPAFEGSPGHEHWRALCGDDGLAAGLFSVVFDERYSTAQVDAFCDALKLFKLGYSWGGPVSLVVPYNIASMRSTRWVPGRTRAFWCGFPWAGGGGRPARGPGAGDGRTGVAVDYPRGLLSLTLAHLQNRNGRPCGDTQLRIREAAERASQEEKRRKTSSRPRPTARPACPARVMLRPTNPVSPGPATRYRTPRRRLKSSSRISRANSAIAAADRFTGAMDFASA